MSANTIFGGWPSLVSFPFSQAGKLAGPLFYNGTHPCVMSPGQRGNKRIKKEKGCVGGGGMKKEKGSGKGARRRERGKEVAQGPGAKIERSRLTSRWGLMQQQVLWMSRGKCARELLENRIIGGEWEWLGERKREGRGEGWRETKGGKERVPYSSSMSIVSSFERSVEMRRDCVFLLLPWSNSIFDAVKLKVVL